MTTNWARSRAFSFMRTRLTCVFAVAALICSSSANSWFDMPLATKANTSRSRTVNASIIRHTAGAISAFVGVFLILPLITQALPSSIRDVIGRYEPATIGSAMTSVTTHVQQGFIPSFSPWVGFAVLCGYAAVTLGIGGWLMVRRDA
jgi:hypothetical protein